MNINNNRLTTIWPKFEGFIARVGNKTYTDKISCLSSRYISIVDLSFLPLHRTFLSFAPNLQFGCERLQLLPYGPSIRNRVLCSGMLLYLHHINFKIFFHSAKFDNFKDEKISDFKTVSVSQRKNLLDWKLVV